MTDELLEAVSDWDSAIADELHRAFRDMDGQIESLSARVREHENFLGHLINNLYGNPNIKQRVMIKWIDDHMKKHSVENRQESK